MVTTTPKPLHPQSKLRNPQHLTFQLHLNLFQLDMVYQKHNLFQLTMELTIHMTTTKSLVLQRLHLLAMVYLNLSHFQLGMEYPKQSP